MIRPTLDPTRRYVAQAVGVTLPDHSDLDCVARLPLPGVVILVHGVNSDGEWYEATEQGLCAGLNARLARRDAQLACTGVEAGQLAPVAYTVELDPEGFLARDRDDKNFIERTPNYSPVIRFRWGYKAIKEDVRRWGANVWLNEHDYWGGGPFANGCGSIADLWSEGLNDQLFLWITAQHLNPVPGRDVYACPPRAYYVHAALRLAKLIESIRAKQPDCPVTVVCHSQGNMIGLAAAFLGERAGAVADSYVLANAPYSLVPDNGLDHWSQRNAADPRGERGRQSWRARRDTLKAWFALLRERAGCQQEAARIDRAMANACPRDGSTGFTAAADRARFGLDGRTAGRVTLYCNPHDQVISASTVQGIGWLGLSQEQIEDTGGAGVFTQRVFAQGWPVGTPGRYHYWDDHWSKAGFWHPPSPPARFSLAQGLESNRSVVGKILTLASAPLLMFSYLFRVPINAEPPTDWAIPIDAPALEPFVPKAMRYGNADAPFDEGFDPAGNARDAARTGHDADDPYQAHGPRTTEDDSPGDAPLGDAHSEAQLRYAHRARLRMKARRSGMADDAGRVAGEDEPALASEDYRRWRDEQITAFLDESVDQNATDHSTTMTHPMHAEKALAYDVAIGVCRLTDDDWRELRVEADWRYASGLKEDHPHRYLAEYFTDGTMYEQPVAEWANADPEAMRPAKVIDEREGGLVVHLGSVL